VLAQGFQRYRQLEILRLDDVVLCIEIRPRGEMCDVSVAMAVLDSFRDAAEELRLPELVPPARYGYRMALAI
jgi:hypothetical protein